MMHSPSAPAQCASGALAVTMTPQNANVRDGCTTTCQMLLEKQYFGDLVGSGSGQMLTVIADSEGSGAYVAIERVSGTLKGKKGAFAVQHAGMMSGGIDELSIRIVADTGSGELAGIAGTMAIRTEAGKQFYELHYTLPCR